MKDLVKTVLSRFRSWAVWVSLAALIVFCVKTFAGVDLTAAADGFLNVLLPCLTAFGIVNDPTNKYGL